MFKKARACSRKVINEIHRKSGEECVSSMNAETNLKEIWLNLKLIRRHKKCLPKGLKINGLLAQKIISKTFSVKKLTLILHQ